MQAADVIANFSLAQLFVLNGHSSKSKARRAGAFAAIFGDTPDLSSAAAAVTVAGNDLVLSNSGALTLRIG